MSDHLIAEANRHAEALPKMTLPTTKPNDRDLAWYVRECELLQDRNEALERENAALRIIQAQDKENYQIAMRASINVEQRLKGENAALREDWQLSERRWVAREKEWAEKTVEIEKENAALKKLIDDPNAMHEYYLRSGNGWEVWHGERLGQMENYIPELQGQIAELRKTLQLIVDKWDSCTELYTSDQDAAQNLADTAREALNRIR